MHTEKSQPEDQWIMSEARVSDADREMPTRRSTDNAGNLVTEFPALSVYRRVGISRMVSETDDRFYVFFKSRTYFGNASWPRETTESHKYC